MQGVVTRYRYTGRRIYSIGPPSHQLLREKAGQIPKKGKGKGKEKVSQTLNGPQQSGNTLRSNCYEPEFCTNKSQQSGFETQIGTQQSIAYGPDIGDDEDLTLRPKVISKADTLLSMRKTRMRPPTSGRRIQFIGDASGVSAPTNLPYSPTKMTWRENETVTSIQLQDEVKNNVSR
ncbi:uncharacterized protein LOC132626621 [Lycium barbarum]|uniref:uncharacterized protein LOC132626621 n=1 Tax=Lycium barbarum TaxID=112863 RepID=UPI00293E9CB3|nr:uncharacterized protein LOC132626621 [Lycium barbarum]XP_060197529.1 uncharacterized protein LOC132626621 [Lycium barbarum]XP_060197530.1 uncharacterized protein LOC132626621 [Lycium barbarum]XP_060197532.1 uncharacterized protein LOC132626621 [Lycium barbarum]XP_060197533.1 uncharacterized protein LOC132626621 [Lycium barbarum]